MRAPGLLLMAVLAASTAAEAGAAERYRVSLPGGRLGDALIALGRQTRTSIGVADPVLAGKIVPPLRGQFTAIEALRQLLRGSGARLAVLDAQTIRIVRDQRAAPAPPPNRVAPPAARPAPRPARPSVPRRARRAENIAAPQPPSQEPVPQTITVTGSRIARPDLASVSPLLVLDRDQIDLTATQTVETLINDLPNVVAGNNRTSNNAGGFAFPTVDLRGLGPTRTLVLIDGEPIPPSSTFGTVDISQVPVDLVERVEVVTGGATTVYGSAAVAGVVNFDLRQDFDGAELIGQTAIAENGSGFSFKAAGLLGGNFDEGRGNYVFYTGLFDRDAVDQSRFDYSRTSAALFVSPDGRLYVADDPGDIIAGSRFFSGGGSTAPPGGVVSNDPANPFRGLASVLPGTFAAADTDCDPSTPGANVNGGTVGFNPRGQLAPFFAGGRCAIATGTSSRYNFAPANYLSVPYNRINVSGIGRYEFTGDTRLRLFTGYVRTKSQTKLAPTPTLGATGFVIDPGGAVPIPADLRAALNTRPNPNAPFTFGRRFNEAGPRLSDRHSQAFIGRVGLEHDPGRNWRIAGTVAWGRTLSTSKASGNINRTAVEQGLAGCVNQAGVSSGSGILPGCVPVDLFGPGSLTPAMVDFIRAGSVDRDRFEQTRVAVNATGRLASLAGGPVGASFGIERRVDLGEFIPDDARQRGELVGFNAVSPQRGSIAVNDVYWEMRLPIAGGNGFPDLLAVEAGARYSDHSSAGGIFNYKLAGEFAPVEWLRMRAAYNSAARPPSIFELFQNGDQASATYLDPCNATLPGRDLAFCAAQGIPADLLPTFSQADRLVQVFAFGQADLREEKARSYTAGIVLRPSSFPVGRLSATVDYYDIAVRGRIVGLPAQFYIDRCAAARDLASDACRRLARDPVSGQISRVNTGRRNSPDQGGPFETRGIDASLDWSAPLAELFGGASRGRIRLSELFSYVIDYKDEGVENVDVVSAGLGSPASRWASTMTIGYEEDSFTAQARWVYKSGGEQPLFGSDFEAGRVDDLSIVDATLRWSAAENLELQGTVQNIFDRYPRQSVSGTLEQANTNVSFFSPIVLGRTYSLQARLRF